MHTEASHRFERGADPEAPPAALARIAHLLGRIDGGSARPGLIDERPVPAERRTAPLRMERASALLGVEVPDTDAARILEGLGFSEAGGTGAWEIPSWRGDVSREADLVEEVARHFGLARIEATLPPARDVGGLRPSQATTRRLRGVLAGAGLSEAIGHSLVSDAAAGDAVPPRQRLENPLSEDQDVLRSSLVVPGLVAALGRNERQGRRDVRLFEIGRVFLPQGGDVPEESTRLGFILAGGRHGAHWSGRAQDVDFFDAKGVVALALRSLGLSDWSLSRDDAPRLLHPGQGARVLVEGESIGFVGTLNPELARRHDVREGSLVAELSLDRLLTLPRNAVRFASLPRFPEVARDLSALWPEYRTSAALTALARSAAPGFLTGVEVSDRYTGTQVKSGLVSLTLTLRFRHAERTLTGEEIQVAVDGIVSALAEAGAQIRGGE
jgi:phenylalanyl-tRNA synthetase beta chain